MKYFLFILTVCLLWFGCKKDKSDPFPPCNGGCTVPCATNYNPSAEYDNGTCKGCADYLAINYCGGKGGKDPCPVEGSLTPGMSFSPYLFGDFPDDGTCDYSVSAGGMNFFLLNQSTPIDYIYVYVDSTYVGFTKIREPYNSGFQGKHDCYGLGFLKVVKHWDTPGSKVFSYTAHLGDSSKTWSGSLTFYPDSCSYLSFDN